MKIETVIDELKLLGKLDCDDLIYFLSDIDNPEDIEEEDPSLSIQINGNNIIVQGAEGMVCGKIENGFLVRDSWKPLSELN